MDVDTTCAMCGEDNESVLHMLVLCREVKHTWRLSPLRLEVDNFEGRNFSDWCSKVREQHKNSQWQDIFWCIAWGLWLRRNAWSFEKKRKAVVEVISKALGLVAEFEKANEASSVCGDCNTSYFYVFL